MAEASAAAAWLEDLKREDWQPLQVSPFFLHPNFLSSFLTAMSVHAAAKRGLFVPFGIGPLFVLVSSLVNWCHPVKESARRSLDVATVRVGLAVQVLLAALFCTQRSVALPKLAGGYFLGALCYFGGRILTVRGRRWLGALVHSGVHVFANAGNLLILPYAAGG